MFFVFFHDHPFVPMFKKQKTKKTCNKLMFHNEGRARLRALGCDPFLCHFTIKEGLHSDGINVIACSGVVGDNLFH